MRQRSFSHDRLRLIAEIFAITLFSTFIWVVPSVAASQSATHAKEITLSGGNVMKNGFVGRWLALIYQEAFGRLGYNLAYLGLPLQRSSMMSDTGKTDGEIARFSNYGWDHPNLVKVN